MLLGFRWLFLISSTACLAQVCRLSVAGLSQSRRVTGQVHAECPEDIVHSAPFGNWGVTSNFGQKHDSHQFDGWCHNTRTCDNGGSCKTQCQDGWYEWNSCTDDPLFRAPNCSLYNSVECTEQVTSTGTNVHGTKYIDMPVRCPFDSNGDGIPDKGGCSDLMDYASGANFMSLYELDPVCCDQLVQTVYFPQVSVKLTCDALGCAPVASEWVSPVSWDSPVSPAKVFAEFAMIVNWGGFVNQNRTCPTTALQVNSVSAASFAGPNMAPDSIASAFGEGLAPVIEQATTNPLPTSLAGITASIKDHNGTSRTAPLFYASPGQVNFLVPAGSAAGAGTVSIYSGTALRSSGPVQIETVVPGLFTANSTGKGVAAANVVQVVAGGTTTVGPVFDCARAGNCVPRLIDLGADANSNYLMLFGTGIRNVSNVSNVSATIGGEKAKVEYAGPQGTFVGLDQVNVVIPPQLKGRGIVNVVLTVNSKAANTVQVGFR